MWFQCSQYIWAHYKTFANSIHPKKIYKQIRRNVHVGRLGKKHTYAQMRNDILTKYHVAVS
jgi:hypothetical protein